MIQSRKGVATMTTGLGVLIERARVAAGLSQRALADATGISQPTLSRIISGDRAAKMPEVVTIAWATGHTGAPPPTVGGASPQRLRHGSHARGAAALPGTGRIPEQPRHSRHGLTQDRNL